MPQESTDTGGTKLSMVSIVQGEVNITRLRDKQYKLMEGVDK